MKRRYLLIAPLCLTTLVALTAHAQIGPGPAPNLTAAPDTFPSLSWKNNCVPVSACTFNVYRGVIAGDHAHKGLVNPTPIAGTSYKDGSAAFGVLNFYIVEAQNAQGVLSAPSNEASARYNRKLWMRS